MQWLIKFTWLNVEHLPEKTGPTTSLMASLTGCFGSWMQWPRHNEDIEYPIKMEARSPLNYKLVCKMMIRGLLFFFKEVKSRHYSWIKVHITFKIGCDLITFYLTFNSLLLVSGKGFEFLFLHCCSPPPKWSWF